MDEYCKSAKSILEIGIGAGNIGVYIRDINPDAELWGVEIFAPYQEMFSAQWKAFSRIYIADGREWIAKTNENFDLIVAFDVVEHMNDEDAPAFIENCKKHCKFLLVSVPIKGQKQDACLGNVYEKHLSFWDVEKMVRLGGKVLGVSDCHPFEKGVFLFDG